MWWDNSKLRSQFIYGFVYPLAMLIFHIKYFAADINLMSLVLFWQLCSLICCFLHFFGLEFVGEMSDFDAISGAIRLIKCTVEGEAADANSNVPTGLTFNCNSQISNLDKFKEEIFFFSCPQQLNRWPCHWLTHWLTVLLLLTLQSDPRDLWPLRHLIRVVTFETFVQSDEKTWHDQNKLAKTMTKTKTFWAVQNSSIGDLVPWSVCSSVADICKEN